MLYKVGFTMFHNGLAKGIYPVGFWSQDLNHRRTTSLSTFTTSTGTETTATATSSTATVVTRTSTTGSTTGSTTLDEETSAGSAVSALGLVTLLFYPWICWWSTMIWGQTPGIHHSVGAIYWKYISIYCITVCLVWPFMWANTSILCWHHASCSDMIDTRTR